MEDNKDFDKDKLKKQTLDSNETKEKTKKIVKPPKPEEKPFEIFINDHFIPSFTDSLKKINIKLDYLNLIQGERPVVGGNCWIIKGSISDGKQFWLCFNDKNITSQKTITLAESGTDPTLLESFLIDEKKTTLALLVSRLLQRLNGQKWLADN